MLRKSASTQQLSSNASRIYVKRSLRFGNLLCVLMAPGTSLGDPVELHAAASALMIQGRQSPLALIASKSWQGHGEPAAGLIALQHAATAAAQRQQLPLLHLRTMNPHVRSVMEMLPTSCTMVAARQPGPMSSVGQEVCTGTSSFAFMVSLFYKHLGQ